MELVSGCVECGLAEPESLASLGGSAPGVVDGILSKTQQLKWLWSKDSMNSTINQGLVEQTQEVNFKLEGSGGSTLVTP